MQDKESRHPGMFDVSLYDSVHSGIRSASRRSRCSARLQLHKHHWHTRLNNGRCRASNEACSSRVLGW